MSIRVPLVCRVQERCGGCPSMGLAVQERERHVWQELAPLLAETASCGEVACSAVLASAREGYRNRLRLQVLATGQVQLFNQQKLLECPVLEPELRSLLMRVVGLSQSSPRLFRGALSAELRGPDRAGLAGFCLTGSTRLHTEALERVLGREVLVGQTGREDIPCQTFELLPGIGIEVPLDGFLQVNHAVNRQLVAAVLRVAEEAGAGSFVDAFMGAGNFALPLAIQGLSGVGIERVPSAVSAACRSAALHGVRLFEVHAAEVLEAAEAMAQRGHRADLLVTDPPRSGLKEELGLLARLRPHSWLMCSCNPRSLVRDVQRARAYGFRLRSLQVFEMFPHTAHWEVLAVLSR